MSKFFSCLTNVGRVYFIFCGKYGQRIRSAMHVSGKTSDSRYFRQATRGRCFLQNKKASPPSNTPWILTKRFSSAETCLHFIPAKTYCNKKPDCTSRMHPRTKRTGADVPLFRGNKRMEKDSNRCRHVRSGTNETSELRISTA